MLGHFKDTSLNVVMRMLTLTGTIELRVDMPVFSLEISTPVGTQQIGQILNLRSTLSNVPEGIESQLRSTCLKARINTLESMPMPDRFESTHSREVLVNFDPTMRRGGSIEFLSVAPVNDAVIEMELVSECPLIVFNTKWILIMTQGSTDQSGAVNLSPGAAISAFDPHTSSLLASSRKSPQPRIDSKPAWLSQDERHETKRAQVVEETSNSVLSTS